MIFRIIASLLVIIILVAVAAVSEEATAPTPTRKNNVTAPADDDMKGMKIN